MRLSPRRLRPQARPRARPRASAAASAPSASTTTRMTARHQQERRALYPLRQITTQDVTKAAFTYAPDAACAESRRRIVNAEERHDVSFVADENNEEYKCLEEINDISKKYCEEIGRYRNTNFSPGNIHNRLVLEYNNNWCVENVNEIVIKDEQCKKMNNRNSMYNVSKPEKDVNHMIKIHSTVTMKNEHSNNKSISAADHIAIPQLRKFSISEEFSISKSVQIQTIRAKQSEFGTHEKMFASQRYMSPYNDRDLLHNRAEKLILAPRHKYHPYCLKSIATTPKSKYPTCLQKAVISSDRVHHPVNHHDIACNILRRSVSATPQENTFSIPNFAPKIDLPKDGRECSQGNWMHACGKRQSRSVTKRAKTKVKIGQSAGRLIVWFLSLAALASAPSAAESPKAIFVSNVNESAAAGPANEMLAGDGASSPPPLPATSGVPPPGGSDPPLQSPTDDPAAAPSAPANISIATTAPSHYVEVSPSGAWSVAPPPPPQPSPPPAAAPRPPPPPPALPPALPSRKPFRPPPAPHSRHGPYFEDGDGPANVTARVGSTARLDCRVGLLHDKTVTWVHRKSDSIHLLTVGKVEYSSDQRIRLAFRYPSNWRLEILYVTRRDEGLYECQVATHPPRVRQTYLKVTAPEVAVVDESGRGVSERYYKAGSAVELTCVASQLEEAGEPLVWRHGDAVLDRGVSVNASVVAGAVVSTLTVERASRGHSGNYTCAVGNLASVTVAVHVLNGELPAAVQHGSGAGGGRAPRGLCWLAAAAAAAAALAAAPRPPRWDHR